MLTEEQKIMRYAGNLICAYDYALYGSMTRNIEKMSKEDCLESIRKLYTLVNTDIPNYDEEMTIRIKSASNIWNYKQQVEKFNNDDITGVEEWNVEEVYKAYNKEKDVIQSSLILGNLCKATGESVGMIACKVGIKKWTLLHWICFQEEISYKFIKAIKVLGEKGEPYTIYDLFDYVSATYGTKNKIKPQEGEQS